MLEIEPDAQVVDSTCAHCGEPMTRVTGFVYRDGDAYAIYYASCYHHEGHEAWIDVVFSPTWEDGAGQVRPSTTRRSTSAGARREPPRQRTSAGAVPCAQER